MAKIAVSIAGASGYSGGELMRLLLNHPHVELRQATSERHAGEPVSRVHPNLRKQTSLTFCALADLKPADLLFLCLPHGQSMRQIVHLRQLAGRIIDLSGDFRLKNAADYPSWYGAPHAHPELLQDWVYGIPELYRSAMRDATCVSSAGCNATATILALYPFYQAGLVQTERTVVEVKVGSSEGGASFSEASHHPVRTHCVRSYKPTGHRHCAEMLQELAFGKEIQIHFTATAIDLVRGILATCHVFLNRPLADKDIWSLYRQAYGDEPFIRIVKSESGLYRLPEPKLLWGSNYCDIGFERDPRSERLVVVSAIDNLMKGSAGQALQAFNIMHGFAETCGLEFAGLHPV